MFLAFSSENLGNARVTTSDTCGVIQSVSLNEQKVDIKSCTLACFS